MYAYYSRKSSKNQMLEIRDEEGIVIKSANIT